MERDNRDELPRPSGKRRLLIKAAVIVAVCLVVSEIYWQYRARQTAITVDELVGRYTTADGAFLQPPMSSLGIREMLLDLDKDGSVELHGAQLMADSPWYGTYTLKDPDADGAYETVSASIANGRAILTFYDEDGDETFEKGELLYRRDPLPVPLPKEGDPKSDLRRGERYQYFDYNGDRYFDVVTKFDGDNMIWRRIITEDEILFVNMSADGVFTVTRSSDRTLAEYRFEDDGWNELKRYTAEESETIREQFE